MGARPLKGEGKASGKPDEGDNYGFEAQNK